MDTQALAASLTPIATRLEAPALRRIEAAARLLGALPAGLPATQRNLFRLALASPPPGLSASATVAIGSIVGARLSSPDTAQNLAQAAALLLDPNKGWADVTLTPDAVAQDFNEVRAIVFAALDAAAVQVLADLAAVATIIASEEPPT